MEGLEKDFVPLDRALKMKELGFDEPCLAKYAIYNPKYPLKLLPQSQDFFKGYFNYFKNSDYKDKIAAPTFSQVFRWFRERGYNFNLVNDSSQVDGDYFYDVWFNGKFLFESHYIYKTYEEVELACLDKLLEIVESKSE